MAVATIALGMKRMAILAAGSMLAFSACRKGEEVTVTETRRLTRHDTVPKLNASNDERFRDAKPSPVKGVTPEGWLESPAAQFRLLNYKFGSGGEAYVSLVSGGVLENVNRWLAQFSAKPLDETGLTTLPKVEIAGTTGVWVEATGDFNGGPMGGKQHSDYALAGIVAVKNGKILTIKMTGPKDEVTAVKPQLIEFAKSLKVEE